MVPAAAAGILPDIPPIAPMPATPGKALEPQRQEHVHWPFSVVPIPGTTLEPGAGGAAAGGAAAGGGGDAAGGAAPEPPAAAVPFCAMAAALNAACDFSIVGLILKAIPFPQ